MGTRVSTQDETKWRQATKLVRGGMSRSEFGETSEALYLTSGYVYPDAETAAARFAGEDDGYVYSRYGNPTVTMFEERLSLLEGAETAFATASGMAAVYGAMACQLKAGDRIVASRALFGSCFQIITNILPRFGVEFTLVDGTDLNQWKQALSEPAQVVFYETPSNPGLEVIDMAAVNDMAHKAGACVVMDNIFATPILQKPLEYGADIIVYSGTKHIDGQGRVMGGAVLSAEEFKEETLKPFTRHTGPACSPFNAWVLLKGLETLSLRVKAQSDAALKFAKAISTMKGIERVAYPYLDSHPQYKLCKQQMSSGGTVVTFDVAGQRQGAFDMMRQLNIIDISNNLGDAKSLITHPASTTHRNIGEEARAQVGIGEGMVRISVGLEDVDDLIEDVEQALDASR